MSKKALFFKYLGIALIAAACLMVAWIFLCKYKLIQIGQPVDEVGDSLLGILLVICGAISLVIHTFIDGNEKRRAKEAYERAIIGFCKKIDERIESLKKLHSDKTEGEIDSSNPDQKLLLFGSIEFDFSKLGLFADCKMLCETLLFGGAKIMAARVIQTRIELLLTMEEPIPSCPPEVFDLIKNRSDLLGSKKLNDWMETQQKKG